MTLLTAIETDLSSRRLFVAVLISHEERLAENILVFLSVASVQVIMNKYDS